MKAIHVGVVGLGLMGSSIVVALLAAGHRVVALAPLPGEKEKAAAHIADLLRHADASGIFPLGMEASLPFLTLVEKYEALAACEVVLECVVEDKAIKERVYREIAAHVRPEAVIASNTSAIPISELQVLVPFPERFLGIHWAEPAYMTRFLEVTCGAQTDLRIAERIVSLGAAWGKEPTLLKKDIRGFITNRLMYAVYREALTLVEEGHITLEDADKAMRYDAGAWVTLKGVLERLSDMDDGEISGTLNRLFGQLSNREDVPLRMQEIVDRGGRGIHNRSGFYSYTPEQARSWELAFAKFNVDIYDLAARYRRVSYKEEQFS